MLCTNFISSQPFRKKVKAMKVTTKLTMIACAIILVAVGIFAVMASQSITSGVQVPEKVSDEAQACMSQIPTLINGVPEDGSYFWEAQHKICLYKPPGHVPPPTSLP